MAEYTPPLCDCYQSYSKRRSICKGFTLIEVLVVLIIVGLVSGVLFQALDRAYGLQKRFGSELFRNQHGRMATDWYRQSVQGVLPDYRDGANVFKGTDKVFSGLSSTPLASEPGAPVPVHWELTADDALGGFNLRYTEAGSTSNILHLQVREARFSYLDDTLTPHDQWPPALGLHPQIPRQIFIQGTDPLAPITLVATPSGPDNPAPRGQDLFNVQP